MANYCLFFVTGVIFATHLPDESVPGRLQLGRLDKLAHIATYGTITFLFFFSLRNSISLLTVLLLFVAILALGTIDEITQPLCNRTASLADWLANLIGVASVAFFLAVLIKKIKDL